MAEKVLIEYDIHAASVHREMNRLDKELIKVQNSTEDFDLKLKKALKNRKAYAEAHVNLKQLQKQFGRTGQAAQQAGGLRGIGFFGQQVGYLVSDARYGILGMANNLSILVPSFQNLQKAAKESGTTLSKEFGKALRGPTGILIAMQLLIVLLPEIIAYFKKWASGSDEVTMALQKSRIEAIKGTVELGLLKKQINAVNLTQKERVQILKDLEKKGVSVRDSDGKWITDLKEINRLIAISTDLVQLRAEARVLEETLVAEVKKKVTAQQAAEGGGWFQDFMFGISSISDEELEERLSGEHFDPVIQKITDKILDIRKKINGILSKGTGGKQSESFGQKQIGILNRFILGDNDALQQEVENNRETLHRHFRESTDLAIEWRQKGLISENEYLEIVKLLKEKYDRQDLALLNQNHQDILNLNKTAREIEMENLIAWYDEREATVDEKESAIADLKKKWREIDLDNQLGTAQHSLQVIGNTLNQAAQLDRKNKKLAKASIIANAAAASIGIWRDYHGEKNTIPTPFNTIAAAVTQIGLIAATAASLKSLNSNTLIGSSGRGGAATSSPQFNIIGASGTNQLSEVIQQQTEDLNNKPVKAQVVASEVETVVEMERQAENNASLGETN